MKLGRSIHLYCVALAQTFYGCDSAEDSNFDKAERLDTSSNPEGYTLRNRKVVVENQVSFGHGYLKTVYALAKNGAPDMIGLAITEAATTSLPVMPLHDGNTCFDKDQDGLIDPTRECAGGHERVLWFPRIEGLPFQWVMFNWQPHGHGPVHIFDQPHFDVHFFIQDYHSRNAIRTGPCGGAFINCDDNVTALLPVPDPFNPVGFGLPGAAGRMGNHLADLSAPPVNGGAFEDAFVYGSYGGHITFWETVYNTQWLANTKPVDRCISIRWAPAVEKSGYYPRKTCVTYRRSVQDFLFTLEDFVWRDAPTA